jgi:hypothetical protein
MNRKCLLFLGATTFATDIRRDVGFMTMSQKLRRTVDSQQGR